jgi:hypothetical protein
MTRPLAWLAALLALGAATAASALEVNTPVTDSVNVIETLKFIRDITDPAQPFYAFVNRLDLQASKGPFAAGVRYDTEAYLLNSVYYVEYIPRKFFFQYDQKPIYARVGDFFARFGHGLTLSLLKQDEFGMDTTIQGGVFRASYQNFFEIEGLGGMVNLGDDVAFVPQRAEAPIPSFFNGRDVLWGGRLMAGDPQYVRVGGSWVGGTLRYDDTSAFAAYDRDNRINIYSAIAEAPHLGKAGSIEAEYAWMEYDEDHKNGVKNVLDEGRAAYLLSNWYLGPVTLILEGTDYYQFNYFQSSPNETIPGSSPVTYNSPPSLEYTDIAFGHLPNFVDAIGGRARVDYTIPGIDLATYVNYLRVESHPTQPATLAEHYESTKGNPWQTWIQHIFAGVDRVFSNGATATLYGGYREIVEGRFLHGQVNGATPIVFPWSINAEVQVKQFQGLGIDRSAQYYDQVNVLGLAYAPWVSLAGTYEWSNEPNGGIITLDAPKQNQPNFWNVEAIIVPAQWARIDIAYGRYIGGLVCSGGVCRQMPPFKGLKTEFMFRF